jgi:putative ABC transport system permease protein
MLSVGMKRTFRVFTRNPTYAATVVLVLALGIGANSAIFSIVQTTLVRTLPFPDPARLVKVSSVPPAPASPTTASTVSPADFIDWHARTGTFGALAAYQGRVLNLTGGDRPEALTAVAASADLFAVLQVRPLLGRVFVPEDDRPGALPVTILSERLWQTRFGADPRILGHPIVLDGVSHVVIGVMSDLHCSVWAPAAAQLWTALAWSAEERAARDTRNSNVIGRLLPGVDLQQAAAEMSIAARRFDEEHSGADRGWGVRVVSVHEYLVSAVRPALLLLVGAVAFVLLIACANASNLVLARALGRGKEMAVRAALGASRGRVVGHLLGENLVLSLVAGGLGLVVASWGTDLARPFLGPRAEDAGLDAGVVAFTLALSVLSGLITGLLPALRATRPDLERVLRQGRGRTDSVAGSWATKSALIVSEVALALVLLIGAGLMIRSLLGLWSVDPGFDRSGLLTVEVKIPETRYSGPSQQARFFAEALARVGALPGVVSAAAVDSLPLTGEAARETLTIEGRSAARDSKPLEVAACVATPGYRRTMRIALRQGRDLDDADGPRAPAVVLISESLARRYWPHEDPIGRRVRLSQSSGVFREIVGVVADVRQDGLDVLEPTPTVYEPLAQSPGNWLSLVVRATAEPRSIAPAVRNAIQKVDPDQPLGAIATMDEVVADSLYERRFSMGVLTVFAGLALVLAAVGIYGVLAFAVGRRAGEIGVRMALGAQRTDVLRLIVAEGMRPTLVGLAIGLGTALALRQVLASLLYGVTAADPLTFAGVSLLLAAVAFLAILLPAHRATRVEVVRALREE